MKKLLLATVALVLSGSANAASNLVGNGGFEAPVIDNSCCNTVNAPGSFPGVWNVTAGDVNVVNGTFASSPSGTNLAAEGNQYLDLIGQSGAGSIAQTIATTAGATYRLSFAYSHNLFGGLGAASANFSAGSLSGSVTHSTGSATNLDWRTFTQRFTASGPSTVVSFTNTAGDQNAGLFLDAVSVAAVPEPAAWAMLIAGFGLVGATLRRRSNVVFA